MEEALTVREIHQLAKLGNDKLMDRLRVMTVNQLLKLMVSGNCFQQLVLDAFHTMTTFRLEFPKFTVPNDRKVIEWVQRLLLHCGPALRVVEIEAPFLAYYPANGHSFVFTYQHEFAFELARRCPSIEYMDECISAHQLLPYAGMVTELGHECQLSRIQVNLNESPRDTANNIDLLRICKHLKRLQIVAYGFDDYQVFDDLDDDHFKKLEMLDLVDFTVDQVILDKLKRLLQQAKGLKSLEYYPACFSMDKSRKLKCLANHVHTPQLFFKFADFDAQNLAALLEDHRTNICDLQLKGVADLEQAGLIDSRMTKLKALDIRCPGMFLAHLKTHFPANLIALTWKEARDRETKKLDDTLVISFIDKRGKKIENLDLTFAADNQKFLLRTIARKCPAIQSLKLNLVYKGSERPSKLLDVEDARILVKHPKLHQLSIKGIGDLELRRNLQKLKVEAAIYENMSIEFEL